MDLVVIATLSAHLLLVDLAMAGPLAALWLDCRSTRNGEQRARQLAISVLRGSSFSLLAAVVLGFGLLAIFWDVPKYSEYFAALKLVPASRLWLALAELAFYFGCVIGYGIWLRRRSTIKGSRWFLRALPVMAATNLMFHFPPLFAIVSVLAGRPDQRQQLAEGMSRQDYYALLLDAEVLSRVIHVWLAAVAVAFSVVLLLACRARSEDSDASVRDIAMGTARWACAATLLQAPIGLWLAFSLAEGPRSALFGRDLVASALFLTAILLSLHLLHLLASAALGDIETRRAVRIVAVMALVVVLMTGAMHRLTWRGTAHSFADKNFATLLVLRST